MLMESNGFYAEINLPDAPEGDGIHALPPYNKQDVYLVDEYKNCPNNWPRNTNKISSYFKKGAYYEKRTKSSCDIYT